MLKERTYSVTNKCLTRLKTSNLDQMLKVRLECHFIRLKRHILSSPANVSPEDIAAIEALSEKVITSPEKETPVGNLERKISQILSSSDNHP